MSPEDSGALPLPPAVPDHVDPVVSAGMSIAMQWGKVLDPEKLEIALKALEPQLKRDHQVVMARLEMQRAAAERAHSAEVAAAERVAAERREQRRHNRHMAGLVVGAVVAVAMLGAGVYVAQTDRWWLSILLCGPSLLALAKVFVLRRSDPDDMKFVSQATRGAMNSAGQVQQPPPA